MEETLCSIPLTAFGWHRIRLGMMTQIPIMNAILNEETEAGMNEEVGGFSSHGFTPVERLKRVVSWPRLYTRTRYGTTTCEVILVSIRLRGRTLWGDVYGLVDFDGNSNHCDHQ